MTIIFQGHVESISQGKSGPNRVRIRIVPAFASCETPIEIEATREETAGCYRPGDSVQLAITPLAAPTASQGGV